MLRYMKGSDLGKHAWSELNEIIGYWRTKRGDVERVLFFAIERGSIVGMSIGTLRPHTVFVDVIVSKKKGAGKALMEAALEFGHQHGKRGVELTSTPEAHGFYKRIGFRRGPLGIDSKNIKNAKSLFSRVEHGVYHDLPRTTGHQQIINRLESSRSSAMKRLTNSTPNATWYAYSALDHKKAFGGKMFLNKNEVRKALPKYSLAVDEYHRRRLLQRPKKK